MKITRLKPEHVAPEGFSHVHINRLPEGRHGWSGSLALGDAAVFKVSENVERSAEAAEAEATDWAAGHQVANLFIETDTASFRDAV